MDLDEIKLFLKNCLPAHIYQNRYHSEIILRHILLRRGQERKWDMVLASAI